jgi:hypothetical protein
MGAGLLAVKSGFILFIKDYQFSLQINTLERENWGMGMSHRTMMNTKVDEYITYRLL